MALQFDISRSPNAVRAMAALSGMDLEGNPHSPNPVYVRGLNDRANGSNADFRYGRAVAMPGNVNPLADVRGSAANNMRNKFATLAALGGPAPAAPVERPFDPHLLQTITNLRTQSQKTGKPAEATIGTVGLEGIANVQTVRNNSGPLALQQKRLVLQQIQDAANRAGTTAPTDVSQVTPDMVRDTLSRNRTAYQDRLATVDASRRAKVTDRAERRAALREYQQGDPTLMMKKLQQIGDSSSSGMGNAWAMGAMFGAPGLAFVNEQQRAQNEAKTIEAATGGHANFIKMVAAGIPADQAARIAYGNNGQGGGLPIADELSSNVGQLHLRNGNLTHPAMQEASRLSKGINLEGWTPDWLQSYDSPEVERQYKDYIKKMYPKLSDDSLDKWYKWHVANERAGWPAVK